MNISINQNNMTSFRALLVAVLVPMMAQVAWGQSVLNVSADFASISDAISAAEPGDTLVMTAGTFSPTGTIHLNKAGLVLKGAGVEATSIDISGFDAWGIHIDADSVLLQNFSVAGDAANNTNYAIHTSPGHSFIRVVNVNVTGNLRTGLDFNGVSGGTIKGVSSIGAASGFGIALSSCSNIAVRDITTAGNAWGDVAVYPSATEFQVDIEAPTRIRFLDSLSLSTGIITVQPGDLASGGVWDPVISTTDTSDALFNSNYDVRVPERMIYTAQADRYDGLDNRIVGAPEDVLAIMAILDTLGGGITFGPQTLTDLETGAVTPYVLGCMDASACSYDSTATFMDEDACIFPDAGYDCDGNIPGCMDSSALNYNPSANVSEACIYIPAGCIPEFNPSIEDTVRVSCFDLLPNPDSIPVVTAFDPCSGDEEVPVISSLEAADLETACGQFVTYRHLALNIEYGVINVQYQTFMVDDTTGPVITSLPAGLVLNCELASDSANWGLVEAVDDCHSVSMIDFYTDSIYVDSLNFPVCDGNWLIARSVEAKDQCGNSTLASYLVTVRDLIPPTLGNIPLSDSLSCVEELPTQMPLHADECSGSELTLTETTTEGDCPQNYTFTRTFVATDGCGNSATEAQVLVVEDTLAPVIVTMPPNMILDCGDVVMDTTITAMDHCSELSIAWLDSIAEGACPQEYSIIRTHTATDECGNGVDYAQLIAFEDNEAPVFTSLPAFVEADCSAVDEALASAFDSCGTAVVTFTTFAAFEEGIAGDQIRLYTATDDCGNAIQGLQMVDFGDSPDCAGCTDSLAVNFDPTATLDNGECNYAGLYDVNGACVDDTDGDGVCDQIEITGCQDTLACNFLAVATDPGLCNYPADPLRDCAGECLSDLDGDGVCDDEEVEGCLDQNACNFTSYASESNTSLCDYGCYGCTYSGALNYDSSAVLDDGLCEFATSESPSCPGDSNGDGEVGIEDLLDVLANFAQVCD